MPRNSPTRRGRAATFVAATLLASSVTLATATASDRTASAATGASRGTVVVASPAATPAGAVALGPLRSTQALQFDVVLRPHHAAELAALATAVSEPGSSDRGAYWSPARLRQAFSPTRQEVASTELSLGRLGLHVRSVSADRMTLAVSAPASTVEHALATRFERFRLPSGRAAYANTRAAKLPATVATRVQALVGLSDLVRYRPLSSRRSTAVAGSGACPGAVSAGSSGSGYTANTLAGAYNMAGLYGHGDTGQGVTVGIFELENNLLSDVKAYERCYGISTPVTYHALSGGATGSAAGSGEAALDIEDVAGLAPGVAIDVYQAPNNAYGPFDEIQYIVDHPAAQVVTTSWGQCEQQLGNGRRAALREARAEQVLFELAAAEGQTWLSASGDDGSTDCQVGYGVPINELAVDDPGSDPYVTSVGGTTLGLGSSRSETVWNQSSPSSPEPTGAGGGGVSELWTMPAYQSTASTGLHVVSSDSSGTRCKATTGYCREVPDVSADADPGTGYVVYWDGGWLVLGGTSGAAPLWAAVVALTDASAACGGKAVGFLNPSLYAVASSSAYASDFHDITKGNNDLTVSGYTGGLYPASAGYDMASGLGSPNVGGASGTGGLAASLCGTARSIGPAVDSVSPSSGPLAGGNTITVRGYGFSGVTSVHVGSKRATFVVRRASSPDPTVIAVTVPAGTAGTRWVTVYVGAKASPHVPGATYTYKS